MTASAPAADGRRASRHVSKRLLAGIAGAVLLVLMVLDTKVVRVGSEQDVRADVFSPEAFGAEQFPRIQSLVEARAVDAATLYAAASADKTAAAQKYGTPAGIAPLFPVTFTGTLGEGRLGVFEIDVDEVPDVRVRLQTGPAINGTELRDMPGDIAFGDFTNQIEFQDAASGINEVMKARVLADLDRDALAGREITVTGVFRMINPKMWLVTPVRLNVQ